MSENQRDPQYKLRWPEELRDKVAASAKAYNRSMNADIIARLERSFLTEPDFSPLNMPPKELERRLKDAANFASNETEELHIEISSKAEKDEQIEKLEEQVSNAMKVMEIMSGFFESMINNNQDEYIKEVTTKYPRLKHIYDKNKATNESIDEKDPE